MKSDNLPIGIMRAFLWSGMVVVATLLFAQAYLMGFVPGLPPSWSANQVADYFIAHRIAILTGALVQCIFWSLWVTWSMAITAFIRKMESGLPVLTYTSLAFNGGGYVFFLLIPMTWSVIAFRAETLDPSIIQVMNDWVWFDWLYTWPPFSMWMGVIGVAILLDKNSPRIFPRWVAFYNFWSALLLFPAGLIGFFKTGPFAYNGAIAFWFCVAVFFGWICIMTKVGLDALNVERRRQAA